MLDIYVRTILTMIVNQQGLGLSMANFFKAFAMVCIIMICFVLSKLSYLFKRNNVKLIAQLFKQSE